MSSVKLPVVQRPETSSQSGETPANCKGKYAFVSLGCPKNLVDSERMLGLLQLDGYQLISEPEKSDFVVVNTCGFIDSARRESMAAIDQMLTLKREGKIRGVIVSGCLAERQREQLLESRRRSIGWLASLVAKRSLKSRIGCSADWMSSGRSFVLHRFEHCRMPIDCR